MNRAKRWAANGLRKAKAHAVDVGRAYLGSRKRDWYYAETRRALERHLVPLRISVGRLTFEVESANTLAYDVTLQRRGDDLHILLPNNDPNIYLGHLPSRIPSLAYWLMSCDRSVETLTATISDGNNATMHRFAPSTNLKDVVPIPDPFFFEHGGFERFHQLGLGAPSWKDRRTCLTWRGAMTGTGLFDPILAFERPALAAQRIAACAILRDHPDTNVRFAYSARPEIGIEALKPFGLTGDAIPQADWTSHRYGIDIDGHTNTWSNLITRLHMGCCMLKVDSRFGYRQWYYDRLKPWEHYVPVQQDLSDLVQQLDWARTHEREAEEIAKRGQELARSLDWESVRDEAVRLVTEHWRDEPHVDKKPDTASRPVPA